MTTTDVVIPARDEGHNIAAVLAPFASHPSIGQVIVSLDMDTTDDTDEVAERYATRIYTGTTNRGKGQCVANALYLVRSPRVIFCDADISGLTFGHINALLRPDDDTAMILGVPDWPTDMEFEMTGQPRKWRRRLTMAWGFVTGQRSMQTEFARTIPDLHGYLMETQLNVAAMKHGIELVPVPLNGLHSPFILTDQRLAEMERDRQWGIASGWLPDPIREQWKDKT